jgi:hypothetical protein
MNRLIIAVQFLLIAGVLGAQTANTPALMDLPVKSSLTVHGITWTFEKGVPVGTFVNGDYYVVGEVTVVSITPKPLNSPVRNGSVLNIPPENTGTGFTEGTKNYDSSLHVNPPISMKPGDALVSTISMPPEDIPKIRAWLSTGNGSESTTKTAAVLTCVKEPLPADSFRPSYCDREQRIYSASVIKWDLLPNLKRVDSMTTEKLNEWTKHFTSPWLDVCFFNFDAPLDYMPHYAAEISRATGIGSLMLMSDFPKKQKEPLMIGYLQYGIDLWGIVRGSKASRGWQAHGGHGSGRKWALIFSGMMLGDKEMAEPNKTYPDLRFGEDMQTGYGKGWTGAKVVYTGHTGLWDGKPVSKDPAWGPYEHLTPDKWPGDLGENYRRCCTSHAWIAEVLAARLMGAMDLWNHPALFDYVDRWMTEDDTDFNKEIAKARKNPVSDWARQRASWDPITNEMWKKYRYDKVDSKKR